jgi:hypothetical protein
MSKGSDKRSVSTDALETLGTIIDDTQKRDAIHLAVEPVRAGQRLYPGDHITVKDGVARKALIGESLGIVDPFLTKEVLRGEMFWFVMYPRQVRSLRHVWSHPSFPDEPEKASTKAPETNLPAETRDVMRAKAWIRGYADELNVGYHDLMESAKAWIDDGDYMVRGGILEGISTSDKFWEQYEVATGQKVDEDKQVSFFSCSC